MLTVSCLARLDEIGEGNSSHVFFSFLRDSGDMLLDPGRSNLPKGLSGVDMFTSTEIIIKQLLYHSYDKKIIFTYMDF